MSKIYSFFLGSFILVNGFGEVTSLKKLSSNAFIQTYNGSEEHRKALRSIEPHLYDFSYCTIKDKDFSGEDLQGATFRDSQLINVNFNRANLTNADFAEVKTNNVTFKGAILWKGFVYSADLSDEDKVRLYHEFSNKYRDKDIPTNKKELKNKLNCLNGLVLASSPSRLKNLDLKKLNLEGINLEGATIEKVDLSGSNLSCAKLNNSCLINVNLEETNLIAIELDQIKFINVKLNNSIICWDILLEDTTETPVSYSLLNYFIEVNNPFLFPGSDEGNYDNNYLLTINDFFKCLNIQIYNMDFTQFNSPNYKLNLDEIELENANLMGCNFTDINLVNASLAHTNLSQVNFSRANLKGANLTGANLISANLTGANLRDVKLGGVRLTVNYSLPEEFDDQELLDSYKFVPSEVKPILKQILISKELIKEGEEPPTKKIKRN